MFSDEAGPAAAEAWIDDWQRGIEERASGARRLAEQLTGVTATASRADGLIEVTVGSSGVLTGLRLHDDVRRRPASWIAEQILIVAHAAAVQLGEQVEQAVTETVGRYSPEGRAIINSVASRLTQVPDTGGRATQ